MSAIAAPTQREPNPGPGDELALLGGPVGVALIAATVLASGVAPYNAYVVNVAVPAGRQLAAGLAVMFVGSVLCAAAPSIDALIGARAAQGLGAAILAAFLIGGLSPVCAVGAVTDRGCALPVVEAEATS